MYYEFGRHQQPHFHARYGNYKASFTIMPPALLAGTMPRRQQNLVIAWAELRYEELMENWQAIEKEQTLRKIAGLQ